MVLSSRDRSTCQRLDRSENPSAKTPPPAFLFPIQQCQRPRPAPPAPLELLIRPGDRRRRLSREAAKPCQPDFSVLFENPRAKPQNPQSRQHVPNQGQPDPNPREAAIYSAKQSQSTGPFGLFRQARETQVTGAKITAGDPSGIPLNAAAIDRRPGT